MIKTIAVGSVAFLALASPSSCNRGDSHRGPSPENQRVCDDISAAIKEGALDDVAHQAQIKLDAAKNGVATGIRHAIDQHYAGKASSADLLGACRNAGVAE